MMNKLLVLLSVITFGCDGDSNGGGSSALAAGVITLSGADTADVGTSLAPGYMLAYPDDGSQPDYIHIVDKSVMGGEPGTGDPTNGFNLVVTNDSASSPFKAVSMTIIVNSVNYSHTCTSPGTGQGDCGTGSIQLDLDAKTVVFTDTSVKNTDTDALMTMNGSVSW